MQDTPSESPANFPELMLAEPLLRAVAQMGFNQPTPVQQKAIPAVLAGKDLLVSAETGSGKTAAFLLPALQHLIDHPTSLFGTRVLILTPTRELASQLWQQCQALAAFTDLKASLIIGGEDFKQQQGHIRRNVEILIATPGRLLELLEQESPDFMHLQLLILDEADRMLDMGFNEAVMKIVQHCNPKRQTLLFSATLTHYGIIKLADKLLNNHQTIALNSLHDGHGNIQQSIILADDDSHKQKILAWLLLNEDYEKALVFTNKRIRTDELQNPLRVLGLRVAVLHGEMEPRERKRTMDLLRNGLVSIIVATDLAARGLDVKGINLVVNFDVPRNGIDYIHRIGRTGRAEATGQAITLVNHIEWNVISGIQRFLHQNFEQRLIKALAGSFKGPKKLKASGKATGVKKTVEEKKAPVKKIKIRERDKKNVGKRRVPTVKEAKEASGSQN